LGFTARRAVAPVASLKLVATDVENGEAPTFLWERLNIRLDENLDRFFT
jgi:hypothetical protein